MKFQNSISENNADSSENYERGVEHCFCVSSSVLMLEMVQPFRQHSLSIDFPEVYMLALLILAAFSMSVTALRQYANIM